MFPGWALSDQIVKEHHCYTGGRQIAEYKHKGPEGTALQTDIRWQTFNIDVLRQVGAIRHEHTAEPAAARMKAIREDQRLLACWCGWVF